MYEHTRKLLSILFDDCDLINFRCFWPDHEKKAEREAANLPQPHPNGHHWKTIPEITDGLFNQLKKLNDLGYGIYYGVNPRTRIGGGKNEDVMFSKCLVADFDAKDFFDKTKPDELAKFNLEYLKSLLNEAKFPIPTAIVLTGGGFHCYWKLDKHLLAEEWQLIQRRLSATLGSDPKIHDPARVLRLPSFYNTKHDPIEVKIIEYNKDSIYKIKDILELLVRKGPKLKDGKKVSGKAAKSYKTNALSWKPVNILEVLNDEGLNCGPGSDEDNVVIFCFDSDFHNQGSDNKPSLELCIGGEKKGRYGCWSCPNSGTLIDVVLFHRGKPNSGLNRSNLIAEWDKKYPGFHRFKSKSYKGADNPLDNILYKLSNVEKKDDGFHYADCPLCKKHTLVIGTKETKAQIVASLACGNKCDVYEIFELLKITYSDLVVKKKKQRKGFYAGEKYAEPPEDSKEFKECTLDEAYDPAKMGVWTTFKARISSLKESPYILPKKTKFFCEDFDGWECKNCLVCEKYHKEKSTEISLDTTSLELLNLIDHSAKKEDEARAIRRSVGAYNCKQTSIKILEYVSIYDTWVIPARKEKSIKDIERMVYITTSGTLKINSIYQLYGRLLEHPKTHMAVFSTTKVERIKSIVEVEDIAEEQLKEARENFTPKSDSYEALQEAVDKNIDDFSKGKSLVFRSFDMHLAKFLSWNCINCKFIFRGSGLKWGIIDAAIIGDTSTAKTQTSEAIIKSTKFGDNIDASNVSVAGLLSGRNKKDNGQMYQTYGKFCIYDENAIVLEEFAVSIEKPNQMMKNLRTTRSSFLVSDMKIGDAGLKAPARCSKIFERNPIRRNLRNSYPYGILTLTEMAAEAPDQRRFDYVLIIAREDSEGWEEDLEKYADYKAKYSDESRQVTLIKAKNLQSKNLEFENDFFTKCNKYGREISDTFTDVISICHRNTMAEKVARLSIALAAFTFNYSKDCKKLLVNSNHAKYIKEWYLKIYTSESCKFDAYSKWVRNEEKLVDEEKIIEFFKNDLMYPQSVADMFLSTSRFTRNHLDDLIGGNCRNEYCPNLTQWINEKRTILIANRAIYVRGKVYFVSSALMQLLKRIRNELCEKNSQTPVNM